MPEDIEKSKIIRVERGSDRFAITVSYDEKAGYYKPANRKPGPAQLGKRYVCAHPLERAEDRKIVLVDYETTPNGPVEIDDCMVYMGCGSEVLCTKAAEKESTGPYCCGMPMSVMEAKAIPSSD